LIEAPHSRITYTFGSLSLRLMPLLPNLPALRAHRISAGAETHCLPRHRRRRHSNRRAVQPALRDAGPVSYSPPRRLPPAQLQRLKTASFYIQLPIQTRQALKFTSLSNHAANQRREFERRRTCKGLINFYPMSSRHGVSSTIREAAYRDRDVHHPIPPSERLPPLTVLPKDRFLYISRRRPHLQAPNAPNNRVSRVFELSCGQLTAVYDS
jgi:hypothetical protein